MINLIEVSNPT